MVFVKKSVGLSIGPSEDRMVSDSRLGLVASLLCCSLTQTFAIIPHCLYLPSYINGYLLHTGGGFYISFRVEWQYSQLLHGLEIWLSSG